MSSVWFADISMESLPGPRPVRPTVSLRPSMACFRQQSARLVDMHALKPCARSCFSLPENLTSPRSTRMPAEPHYPLSFQKSPYFIGKISDRWCHLSFFQSVLADGFTHLEVFRLEVL